MGFGALEHRRLAARRVGETARSGKPRSRAPKRRPGAGPDPRAPVRLGGAPGAGAIGRALTRSVGYADLHASAPSLRRSDAAGGQLRHLHHPRSGAERSDRPAASDHPLGRAGEHPRGARPRRAAACPVPPLASAVLRERTAQRHRAHLGCADRRQREPAAGDELGDPVAGRGPHRGAHAADPLGGRALLRRRHPDRDPDRRDLRVPAVFLVRPARHLHFDGRLLGSDLLHRPASDRGVQRLARLGCRRSTIPTTE